MLVNIKTLTLWPGNYNSGDVGAIALSIRKFGYKPNIGVWKDGEVRAGNHTLLALLDIQKQGALPALDFNYPPPNVTIGESGEWYIEAGDMSHLDENEALAFAIADNHSAQRASQDEVLLSQYLQNLYAVDPLLFEATGYDEGDVELMSALTEPILGETFTKTPTEALDYYLNGQIKQIVLYFDHETYVLVIARMQRIMDAAGLEGNTDVFMRLLEAYEDANSQPATENA